MTDAQQNLDPEEIDEVTRQLIEEFKSRQRIAPEQEDVVEEEETVEEEEQEEEKPSYKYAWQQSEEDLAKVDELYKWANSLTPDQVQLIDRVLSGQFQPTPPPAAQEPEDEEEDDEITLLRRRLAALEQDQLQQRTQQTIKSTQQEIEDASFAWAEQYGLSESELEIYQTELVRSGMFRALAEAHGHVEGTKRGLDYFYKQSDRYAEQQAEAIRQKALAEQQRLEERARKASAFSGGSGSVTAPDEPPTRQGHKKRANLSAVARFLEEQN